MVLTLPLERILKFTSGIRAVSHVVNLLQVDIFKGTDSFVLKGKLPRPPCNGQNEGLEVKTTSLHWAKKYEPNAILVSYMYHGVV